MAVLGTIADPVAKNRYAPSTSLHHASALVVFNEPLLRQCDLRFAIATTGAFSLHALFRRNALPEPFGPCVIPIEAAIVSSSPSATVQAQVAAGLHEAEALFRPYGLGLAWGAIQLVPHDDHVWSDNLDASEYRELWEAHPDLFSEQPAFRILFVKDLRYRLGVPQLERSCAGLSPGVPAPVGANGARSSMVIRYTDGLGGPERPDELGCAIAHELGHCVGLQHENGTLMSATKAFRQRILRKEQAAVARSHPFVRPGHAAANL